MSRPDLMQFCSKEHERYYIAKPWRRGAFTYATNGHICVRVDAIESDEEQPKAPDAEKVLLRQLNPIFAPLRIRRLPDPPRRKCELCMGLGKWEDVGGVMVECEYCDGVGAVELMQSVSIAGAYFETKCINMIAELPDAEFPTNPLPDHKDWRKTVPTSFRFAGGIGALMPMGKGAQVHIGELSSYALEAAT